MEEIYTINKNKIKVNIIINYDDIINQSLIDYITIFNKISESVDNKKYNKIDGVVYCITNNNKKYIGTTINLRKRLYRHIINNLYTEESSICILKEVNNVSKYELELYEDYFINKFDTVKKGLNNKYNNVESRYLFYIDRDSDIYFDMLNRVAEYKVRYTLWESKLDKKLINKTGIFSFTDEDNKYMYYTKRRLRKNIQRMYKTLIDNTFITYIQKQKLYPLVKDLCSFEINHIMRCKKYEVKKNMDGLLDEYNKISGLVILCKKYI